MKIYSLIISNYCKYKPNFNGNEDTIPSCEIDPAGQSVRDYLRLRHDN